LPLNSEEIYNYYSRNLDGTYTLDNIDYASAGENVLPFKYTKETVDNNIQIVGYYYNFDKIKFIDKMENRKIISTRYFDFEGETIIEVEYSYKDDRLYSKKTEMDGYRNTQDFNYLSDGSIMIHQECTSVATPTPINEIYHEATADAVFLDFNKPKSVSCTAVRKESGVDGISHNGMVRYEYDPVGNMLFLEVYDLTEKKVTQRKTFEYLNGNLIQKNERNFYTETGIFNEIIQKFIDDIHIEVRMFPDGIVSSWVKRIKPLKKDLYFEYDLGTPDRFSLYSMDEKVGFKYHNKTIQPDYSEINFILDAFEVLPFFNYKFHGSTIKQENNLEHPTPQNSKSNKDVVVSGSSEISTDTSLIISNGEGAGPIVGGGAGLRGGGISGGRRERMRKFKKQQIGFIVR
jgi:hypothetical protein